MLCAGKELGYVFEPFSPGPGPSSNPRPFDKWFVALADHDVARVSDFERILGFRYPFWSNLRRLRGGRDGARLLRQQVRSLLWRAQGRRALLKDPIALYSAEWVVSHFEADVVVMIRHPAAFCSSLKVKNWSFDFWHFASQPELMARYSAGMQSRIQAAASSPPNLLNQAILLWNCTHLTIADYQARHPEWHFVLHENCSRDPLQIFQQLYSGLGLAFNSRARRVIEASSGEDNPSDQVRGREFLRNSRLNVDNWRRRLTLAEVATIRRETAEVSDRWYGDESW